MSRKPGEDVLTLLKTLFIYWGFLKLSVPETLGKVLLTQCSISLLEPTWLSQTEQEERGELQCISMCIPFTSFHRHTFL